MDSEWQIQTFFVDFLKMQTEQNNSRPTKGYQYHLNKKTNKHLWTVAVHNSEIYM